MAAMHYLAVLMMLLCGVVSGEHLINVSESGNDTLRCLSSNTSIQYSCKTMDYVFQQISAEGYPSRTSSILVRITYNQTISNNSIYKFGSGIESLTVTVSGIGLPFINCKPHSILVNLGSMGSNVNWVWQGLVFSGCGFLANHNDTGAHSSRGIKLQSLNSLVIHYCWIRISYLIIHNIPNVTISHNELGNKCSSLRYCPKLEVLYSGDKKNNFSFSHNIFANCRLSYEGLKLTTNYKKFKSVFVTIKENNFSCITSIPRSKGMSTIISTTGESAMLTIQNNIFQQNSLHYALYHTYAENIISRPKLIIQQNCFLSNAKPPAAEYKHTRSGLILINIISAEIHIHGATLDVCLLENYFIDNNDVFAINIVPSSSLIDITIDKLTILNNTAYTSIINGFIDIQNSNTKSYVQITNVTAKGNSVNTEITSRNLYIRETR